MSQPKSNGVTLAQELRAHAGYPTKFHPEYDLVIRLETAQKILKEALAQKDDEVADREKYVPRFKGVNIFSGEEVEGAGCYTSEKGTAYILEDNNGEEPTFTPVKEINYDWYTPKE